MRKKLSKKVETVVPDESKQLELNYFLKNLRKKGSREEKILDQREFKQLKMKCVVNLQPLSFPESSNSSSKVPNKNTRIEGSNKEAEGDLEAPKEIMREMCPNNEREYKDMTNDELINLVKSKDQVIERLKSNVENKVLHEKMLLLEEELCMKNKLLNELQHETDSSVIEPQLYFDENLSRISASSKSSDDSVEILQECLSIASKNVSSLMKIKSEPVIGNEFDNTNESFDFSQESLDTDNSSAMDVSINTSTPVHPKIVSTKSLSKKNTKSQRSKKKANATVGNIVDNILDNEDMDKGEQTKNTSFPLEKPGKAKAKPQRSKKNFNTTVGNIVDNLLDNEDMEKGDQRKNTSLPLETLKLTTNKNTGKGVRSKVAVAPSNTLSSWLSSSSTTNQPKTRKRKREDDVHESSNDAQIKIQPFATLCAKWSNIFKQDIEG